MTNREAVGRRYDAALMRAASTRSWAVLEDIRQRMQPGITEEEAQAMSAEVFAAHEVQRLWHKPMIRIGRNTRKTWRQRSEPGVTLGENDLYFIDLGLVFDGHEGDVGATFVTGDDADHARCAHDAKALFDETAAAWREEHLSGAALYARAGERAAARGWTLNHAVKGHRVSDYPHRIHQGGDLGDFEGNPAPGVWVLEIQIAHPTAAYGAFYEDLLSA